MTTGKQPQPTPSSGGPLWTLIQKIKEHPWISLAVLVILVLIILLVLYFLGLL